MINFLTKLISLFSIGYSIFVVVGELPDCEADFLLKMTPAVQQIKPRLLPEFSASTGGGQSGGRPDESWDDGDEDFQLRQVMEESRRQHERDDMSLRQALQLSMAGR